MVFVIRKKSINRGSGVAQCELVKLLFKFRGICLYTDENLK